MRPVYSSLCDTDRESYLNYLEQYGKFIDVARGLCGSTNDKQHDCCSYNVGRSVVGASGHRLLEGSNELDGYDLRHDFSDCQFDFVNNCSESAQRDREAVGGLADSGSGPECSGSRSGDRDESVSGRENNDTANGDGSMEKVIVEPVVPSVVLGKNNRKNRRRREIRRLKTWRRKDDDVVEGLNKQETGDSSATETCLPSTGQSDVRVRLRESLERKWQVENELAAERASRALAVLRGNDVEGEIRRYRTRVAVQSERNMVGVEKAHAVLRATGNVPSLPGGGFAETVVSDNVPSLSSGSISPNSSASMAEFRAQQKALLDLQAEHDIAKRALARCGYSIDAEKNIDKQTFTDDSVGNRLLEQLEGEYGGIHYVERDGVMKMKLGPNNDICY